jgi:hypothetical protein
MGVVMRGKGQIGRLAAGAIMVVILRHGAALDMLYHYADKPLPSE